METGIETIQIHFRIDGWTLSQGIFHNYSISCTMLNKHCVRRWHDYFAEISNFSMSNVMWADLFLEEIPVEPFYC